MNYNKKRILPVLVAIIAVLLSLAVLSSSVSALTGPLNVNKTVRNPNTGEWVKELTANMNDTVQFKCTITNHPCGCVNLTQVRFWDIMDCSLNYSLYSLKINGADQTLPDCWVNRFKPKVLHPHPDLEWDLNAPTGVSFVELCPQKSVDREIVNWTDTNGDLNVSACDQVELTGLYGSQFWYHVDRVPYTLVLRNATSLDDKYFDSVLNWNDPGMNLSDPNGTEWFEVCCCKDKYILMNWTDGCPNGYLSASDQVVMKNERTGEEKNYTVNEEVAIDLVVSREYEIDEYRPDLIPLQPGETITIVYNATVVRCGVDNNTFRAKGWDEEYSKEWKYSNEDKVTITVLCSSGEATDPAGLSKEVYTAGEPVYAVGSGFDANKSVDIYIVPFQQLNDDVAINTLGIIVGPVPVTTDENGDIDPELVWPNPVPGRYLMIFDDPDGDYNQDRDPLDDFSVTGGAAPVVTPLGLVALIGLLSIVATSTILRRKKR